MFDTSSTQPNTNPTSTLITSSSWVGSPIGHIPFLFHPLYWNHVMVKLNLQELNYGLLKWYLTPPNPPPTPQLFLTHVQPMNT
jgi:hypothetical protein